MTASGAKLLGLGVALGCGLLIGIERERRKGNGPARSLAGVRTFTLASLGGRGRGLGTVVVAPLMPRRCGAGSEGSGALPQK